MYVIPQGQDRAEYEEHTRELLEQGFRHIKFGWGSGMTEHDKAFVGPTVITDKASLDSGSILEPSAVCRNIVRVFEQFRSTFGPNPEILFDVKAFMPPIQGLALAKDVEQRRAADVQRRLRIGWVREPDPDVAVVATDTLERNRSGEIAKCNGSGRT